MFEDLASSISNTNCLLPVTLSAIGSVLTTESDHIDNTRLAKGYDRQRIHYIGGIVDFTKRTFTSVALPLPTAAHGTANKEQTLEEQVNADKLIRNLANSFRTEEHKYHEYIRRIVQYPIVPYVGGQPAKIGVLVSKQDQTRHNHACRLMVCDTK